MEKDQEQQAEQEQQLLMELDDLPENCISTILSLTSPLDACRSSLVSSIFKSASESDELWDKFLPSDYQEILSKSSSEFPSSSSSKKDLYFHLSDNPILIDDGNKSFQIEKGTGKKCFMIGARELYIVWGDTSAYWTWRSDSGSRFAQVAVLNHVWWLEIRGKIDTKILSRNTTYGSYLVFTTQTPLALDYDASVASVGGGGERAVCFALDGSKRAKRLRRRLREQSSELGVRFRQESSELEVHLQRQSSELEVHFSVKRGDGWMEIELGEFFNDEGEDGEVEMSLMEVKGGGIMSGLIVQGIEVRPKGSKLCSC